MEEEKVHLTKGKETYLATLYGKAIDAALENPILGDRLAADAVARIDYDFKVLKLPNSAEITLAMRAWHFDQWTRAFLAVHPESTVLHLGCGLDTRVYRINPGPSVRWFDIDLPHVIALREELYPEREAYRRIGSSVTDLSWLDGAPIDLGQNKSGGTGNTGISKLESRRRSQKEASRFELPSQRRRLSPVAVSPPRHLS